MPEEATAGAAISTISTAAAAAATATTTTTTSAKGEKVYKCKEFGFGIYPSYRRGFLDR
jgi:hypothetical protein